MPVADEDPLIDGRPLSELRVVDLKDELEKRGLSKSGNKTALQMRLKEALTVVNDSAQEAGIPSKSKSDSAQSPSLQSSPIVQEYLEKRQQALQTARKEAEAVRAAASSDTEKDENGELQKKEEKEKMEEDPAEVTSSSEHGQKEESPTPESDAKARQSSPESEESGAGKEEDEEETRSRSRSSRGGEDEALADDADPGSNAELLQTHATKDTENGLELGDNEVGAVVVEETGGEVVEEKPAKKRKWGSTRTGKRRTAPAISTDSLRDLGLGTVKAMEDTLAEHGVELDYDEQPPDAAKRVVVAQEEDEEDGDSSKDAGTHKRARIVVEEEAKLAPESVPPRRSPSPAEEAETEEGLVRGKSPSPARYPVDQIVHIRCLTRPFTQRQLYDVLSLFGEFLKEEFWMDNIKSNCIVKYASVEQAEKARQGLHNVRWPSSNPKLLRVDFASQDVLDRHRGILKSANVAEDQNSVKEAATRPPRRPREEREKSPVVDKWKRRSRSPVSKAGKDVWPKEREWDKGKNWQMGESPPREERRRRRSRTPAPLSEDRRAPPKPAKLLDELFRKTTTTPCLYWLPLTLEQSLAREMEKKQKENERVERVEKQRRMEEEERAARRVRRPRSPSPFRRR